MAQAGEKKDRLAKLSEFKDINIEWSAESAISPEIKYIKEVSASRRQRFAQFFTPEPIARMMAQWVAEIRPKCILEPSVGTGILIRVMAEMISNSRFECIDIDQAPLALAKKSMPSHLTCDFLQEDFLFRDCQEDGFDGILSNPPYLRHHDIAYDIDIHEEIGRRNRVVISKACNLYVLFIFEICRLLSVGGRAAILVPADWLNSNAAQCLRSYLFENRILKELLYFDESDHHFDGALTTSVVLLLQKDSVKNPEFLVRQYSSGLAGVTNRVVKWEPLRKIKKWNSYLLGETLDENDLLINLSTFANTKRGLATGANEFFHLTRHEAVASKISPEHLLPCIGSARDVSGFIFTHSELLDLQNSGAKTQLVNLFGELSKDEIEYIKCGEERQYHERFLLSRRSPWFKNEKREAAPIWAASFGRERIRFIWNQSSAINLTTYHCIYPKNLTPFQIGALVCLLNSSPIQERFMEHLRVLGGGLLKFQPNDLLQIKVPDVRTLSESQLSSLNAFLMDIDDECRIGKLTSAVGDEPIADLNEYVKSLLDSETVEAEIKTEVLSDQLEMF